MGFLIGAAPAGFYALRTLLSYVGFGSFSFLSVSTGFAVLFGLGLFLLTRRQNPKRAEMYLKYFVAGLIVGLAGRSILAVLFWLLRRAWTPRRFLWW